MGPTTRKGKRVVKKARQKADAVKGASLRTTGFLPHEIKDLKLKPKLDMQPELKRLKLKQPK